jgi:hypothetical protein
MRQVVSSTAILSGLFIVFAVLLGCASVPSTALSKTRELTIPELDGTVYISGIQYGDNIVSLTSTTYVSVANDSKRIAILSIQIKNTIAKKEYNLSPIVLLDGDTRIEADGLKYFSGNSVLAADWGVKERSFLNPLTIKGKRRGPYTVNLIYVIDVDKTITQAELFGQIVEFNSDLVALDVIDKFH